jgi:histidine triad (HIT) family protein
MLYARLLRTCRFLSSMSTAEVTIFDKIVKGEIPSSKVFEDEIVLAFKDINPAAPVHVLLIPKNRDGLDRLSFAEDRHKDLLGHMMITAPKVAKAAGLSDYRLVINDGSRAGQTVFHLHMHILGGGSLNWPPI